jgi:hypothetical protein
MNKALERRDKDVKVFARDDSVAVSVKHLVQLSQRLLRGGNRSALNNNLVHAQDFQKLSEVNRVVVVTVELKGQAAVSVGERVCASVGGWVGVWWWWWWWCACVGVCAGEGVSLCVQCVSRGENFNSG